MKIQVQKLSESATIPTYAHAGDAGLDLYAAAEHIVLPGERALIPTDIALAIPDGYYGLVVGRSGNTVRNGFVAMPGIIDSGYRGGIGVMAFNLDAATPFVVHKGDRIGQLIVQYAPHIDLSETDSLRDSERSANGFGSTGK